ncbi:MAG TPA: hypothetical protein PK014_03405 [Thermoanaerobaculia bacterium]|nr:hypothetical protein [Thermoanaerobaculia bacterium]HUM29179.1 hypothetical protein [Thermoanaerobaculia bacterium]HXK67557.1 hypothetical protein [Thermoanaerobaculia bacterium]
MHLRSIPVPALSRWQMIFALFLVLQGAFPGHLVYCTSKGGHAEIEWSGARSTSCCHTDTRFQTSSAEHADHFHENSCHDIELIRPGLPVSLQGPPSFPAGNQSIFPGKESVNSGRTDLSTPPSFFRPVFFPDTDILLI